MVITEERTIELTLISATDLKKVKKFGGEQKCYVVAYIYPSQRQTSHADPYGGVNPIWNASLTLTCFESHLHPTPSSSSPPRMITLDIYCHSSGIFHSGGDKLVGTVTVPLADVGASPRAEGTTKALDVRLPSGETQGTLNLSIKLGAKRTLGEFEDPSAPDLPSYSSDKVGASTSTQPPVNYMASGSNPGQASTSEYPPFNKPSPSQVGASPSTQPPVNYMASGSNPKQASTSEHPPLNKPSPSPNTFDNEDIVTGYPTTGYGFAPLGQMPVINHQQFGQVPMQGQQQYMLANPGQNPYTVYSPEVNSGRDRRGRKGRRAARRGRDQGGGGRRRGGPISLAVHLIGGVVLGVGALLTK